MASVPSASSSATLAASSRPRSPIRPIQPPCLKPSVPAGSWTTPSSETFSLMTIFPMSVLLWGGRLSTTTDADTATPGNWAPAGRLRCPWSGRLGGRVRRLRIVRAFGELAVDEGRSGPDERDQVRGVDHAPAALGGLDQL